MTRNNTDETNIEMADPETLNPCERRVVSVEPISGDQGSIEVHAVYRHGGAKSDRDDHKFVFGYHYLADDRSCSLGLSEWEHPSKTVTAIDMSVLKYVVAYFNEYGLSVDVSIPVGESQVAEFEADTSLQFKPDSGETDESSQWVEGP